MLEVWCCACREFIPVVIYKGRRVIDEHIVTNTTIYCEESGEEVCKQTKDSDVAEPVAT